jgi:hypothetical protein
MSTFAGLHCAFHKVGFPEPENTRMSLVAAYVFQFVNHVWQRHGSAVGQTWLNFRWFCHPNEILSSSKRRNTGQGVEFGPVEKILSVLFQQLVKNPKNLANFV